MKLATRPLVAAFHVGAGLALVLLAIPICRAQTPATVPPVPDAARISAYNVTSPTTTFSVGFPVYGDCTDLIVTQNGQAASLGTDFYCQSASGTAISAIPRPITDLQVVFANPVASGPVTIQSLWRPRNTAIPTAPGITRTEFERSFNTLVSGLRDLQQQYASSFPQPALYGAWNPTQAYPPNAVVTFGAALWQAAQSSVDQQPQVGSIYWTLVTNPPSQVTINNFQLPGQPVAIAAASTTDLGTLSNHYAQITGSGVSVASFGSSCSPALPLYWASFAGVDTLVYNATSLILPTGGSNITTTAGDQAVLECLGSGNWQIISYTPITGLLPSKAVVAFNTASCPAGWTPADGTNSTADLRGKFVRGLDNGAGVDPGRALASPQADQVQSFAVTTTLPLGTAGGGARGYFASGGASSYTSSSTVSGASFGTETRPKNVALLYCQKL